MRPWIGLLVFPVFAGVAGAEPWTLTRALDVALAHSPDARIAELRTEAARAFARQADAAWYPHLTVQGGYTETNSPMTAFGSILNQRAFDSGLDFNHPGRIDDFEAAATLAYEIYNGGRATAGRQAARSDAAAATQELAAARHQLAAEVVKAYLGLVKARESVGALVAGEKAYAAAVANARLRFAAGQMLKADLLNLEVELARTRGMLLQARRGVSLAGEAFLNVLGVTDDQDGFTLADHDPALDQLKPPGSDDFMLRPELLGLEERVRSAEAMADAARGARRPNVSAFAGYQYDRGWQLDRQGDSWTAGVAVSLNVFDGGETTSRIRQAEAGLAGARELQRKVLLGISLEVKRARFDFENAGERLAVCGQAVAQAEESADLSRARFEKGALLTADLIAVEGRLVEARLQRTLATADERIALVEWRRAVGLSPLDQP